MYISLGNPLLNIYICLFTFLNDLKLSDVINIRAPRHEFAKSLYFKTSILLLSSHFNSKRYLQLNIMIKIVMRDFLLKINGFCY